MCLSDSGVAPGAQDTELKAELIGDTLKFLNIGPEKLVIENYIGLAAHPETLNPML